MITTARSETFRSEVEEERIQEKWNHWPICWSGIVVGSLSAVVAVMLLSLIGVAIGAHLAGNYHRIVDLKSIHLGTAAFAISSAFFAFVIGGWVTTKIGGILRSEPAMLHGAVTWLLAVILLVVGVAIGAGGAVGGWFAGIGMVTRSEPTFSPPQPLGAVSTPAEQAKYQSAFTEYNSKVTRWHEETPRAARNAALCTVTALLLGLMGSVLGGWLASGEPMSFTHYRLRPEFVNR